MLSTSDEKPAQPAVEERREPHVVVRACWLDGQAHAPGAHVLLPRGLASELRTTGRVRRATEDELAAQAKEPAQEPAAGKPAASQRRTPRASAAE